MRVLFMISFLWVAFLLVGCGSTFTLDPGLWQLSVDLMKADTSTRDTVELSPQGIPVEVVLNWTEDGEETVEIHYAGSDPERKRTTEPITGVIEASDKNPAQLILRARGADENYEFLMWGDIVNSRKISKGRILGRHRVESNIAFEGEWQLRKLSK